jgi:peptide/nickel transport system substrate-binding protein
MNKRNRIDLVVLVLLVCLSSLTGCMPTASPTASSAVATAPTELRVALTFSSKTLDPVKSSFNVMRTGTAETLFRIDPAGALKPWLATGYEQVDQHTWKIAIRSGVRFHNGDLVDAGAVKTSLERALQESPLAPGLLRAERIEVAEDHLVIRTEKPHPAVIHNLAHPVFAIVHAQAAASEAAGFGNRPVMTGPYRIKAFQPEHSVVVERNPQYWGGTPAFDQITFRFITDPNTRAMALRAGEVHLATDIPVEAAVAIEEHGTLLVDSSVGARIIFIHFNLRKPPFDDPAVRQAVSLAIDREALAQNVMMGFATPATGLFPSSLPYGGIKTDAASYRQDEAHRLLDGTGWAETTSGVRAKNGVPLEVTLLSYPQRPELNVMAEAIQGFLADIGIKVKVQVVQDITAEVKKGTYDFTMWNQLTAPTADPLFMLDSWFQSGAPNNYMGYSNRALDELIRRMATAFDQPARHQSTVRAQQMLLNDGPVAVLLYPKVVVGRDKRLVGVTVHPLDYYLADESWIWDHVEGALP